MKSMSIEAAILIPHFWLVVLFVACVLITAFLAGVCFLRITRHMQHALDPSPESKVTPLGYYSAYQDRRVAPNLHKRTRRLTRELYVEQAGNETVELEKQESGKGNI